MRVYKYKLSYGHNTITFPEGSIPTDRFAIQDGRVVTWAITPTCDREREIVQRAGIPNQFTYLVINTGEKYEGGMGEHLEYLDTIMTPDGQRVLHIFREIYLDDEEDYLPGAEGEGVRVQVIDGNDIEKVRAAVNSFFTRDDIPQQEVFRTMKKNS